MNRIIELLSFKTSKLTIFHKQKLLCINFTEEMFERVCAERCLNSFPFDNAVCNDDEDDIWEHQVSTTITSNLADKQTCGDWQQRRNSDADDPMANKLDGTIVDRKYQI